MLKFPSVFVTAKRVAQPDVAIITNIGDAHIEFLGSRDAIAQEKGSLAEALTADGHLVLNSSDAYSDVIASRTRASVIRAGLTSGAVQAADIATDADGSEFTLKSNGCAVRARLGVPGTHMIENALLAVATGLVFNLSLAECASALTEIRLTKGRLEQKIIRGIRVIDDTYNANPDSMRAALATLAASGDGGKRGQGGAH